MQMTKHDIKNYLQKIYNVDVIEVRTAIDMGRFKRDRLQNSVIKENDRKLAYVVMVRLQLFSSFSLQKISWDFIRNNFVYSS